MGTILQQRVPQQCPGRLCAGPGWRKTATWSDHRPEVVDSYSTEKLQPQKKSQPPQNTASQANMKKPQSKRKHKSINLAASRMSKLSSQVTSEFQSPVPPLADQSQVRAIFGPVTHSKLKHMHPKSTRHTAAFPCHRPLADSSPDRGPRLSTVRESVSPGDLRDDNSDTDLSESERLSDLPTGGPPPQLKLRPEVKAPEEPPPFCRHKSKSKFDFPDFLPPPFNSWSLSQLSMFYNMEGGSASRPRPTGPLERYLERLLQLEWYQIQSWQDKKGTTQAEPLASSHRGTGSTSSRLSAPKCILQCQRAFPLTFLSSVPSHCAYIVCRTRNSSCSCRGSDSQARPSQFSPISLPQRSYSESRVPTFERTHRLNGPVRSQGHLKQMQAAGNLRTSVQGANNRLHSTARDPEKMGKDNVLDCRTGGVQTRSGSEYRKNNVERQHGNCAAKRRGRSECRKGHAGRREQEIKPDAVTAIMDNLPATKYSAVNRRARSKQVEFVT